MMKETDMTNPNDFDLEIDCITGYPSEEVYNPTTADLEEHEDYLSQLIWDRNLSQLIWDRFFSLTTKNSG